MIRRQPTLKIVPSLRADKLMDGRIVLTRKFIEGVNEFTGHWGGAIEVYFECSRNPYDNLDEVAVRPGDLAFGIRLLSFPKIQKAIVSDPAAVVLLSLDDCRQSGFSALCRQHGIGCAYISEYSLETRKQIVDAGTSNPLKRWRRKLWETGEEKKRVKAVKLASGLQCNGTPTYDAYRELSPSPLLYFDTRVSKNLLPTTAEIILKHPREPAAAGPLRLLYSGRLTASKGADHLLPVAMELRKRNVDFRFVICGDGDLKNQLADGIRAADLSNLVSLAGVLDFRTELVPLVKSDIDLFVCCHPQGDPSCTYLETMSCGVPIAGYANEAFEGVVRHSGCGWTVPVGDSAALAAKIAEIDRSREALLEMSLASLAFATDHTFDITFGRRIQHLMTLSEKATAKN